MIYRPSHGSASRLPRRRFALDLTVLSACLVALLMLTRHVNHAGRAAWHSQAVGTLVSKSKTPKALSGLGITGSWHLTLNAGFGKTIDPNLWQTGWFGTGITGPISQTYESACYDSDNASVYPNGILNLKVTAVPSNCTSGQHPYSGALLSTNPEDGRTGGGFQYQYGALQVRVYLPGTANGEVANWPSVVTLGQDWPQDGEDDVLEGLNGQLCSNFHSPSFPGGAGVGVCAKTTKPGWHTITADWEPGSVTWYYGNTMIKHVTQGVTSAPMYIVLANTTWVDMPRTTMPDTMKVAYVRVWQHGAPS